MEKGRIEFSRAFSEPTVILYNMVMSIILLLKLKLRTF